MKIPKKTTYSQLWTDDFDKDGISNIDDQRPFDKNSHRRVNSEVSLSDKYKGVKGVESNYRTDIPKLKKMVGAQDGRVKKTYSTIGKQMGRYLSNVKDMGGVRVLTNSKKENNQVLRKIKNEFKKCKKITDDDCIFEVDNKYKQKRRNELPYLGYHVGLRYNGLPYEVQIKCKDMQKIQDKAHPFYKRGKYKEANKLFRPQIMKIKRRGC
jgi:(p)ppGpp synthase/HD superfamily hydrolase